LIGEAGEAAGNDTNNPNKANNRNIGENGNNGDIGGLKLYGIGHLVCGTKLITSNLFNCLGDGEVAVKDYCKYI